MTTGTAHRNNFDLIRLFAALTVVVFHYRLFFKIPDDGFLDPVFQVIALFPGVPIFFVISGYLVSRSFENSRSHLSYARKRILRIYPGLWVCLVFSMVTVWISGYWADRPPDLRPLATWLASEVVFGHIYSSSVFSEYGVGVLNGSLWTIPVELQFYLVLPIIVPLLGLSDRRFSKIAVSIGFLGICLGLFVIASVIDGTVDALYVHRLLTTNTATYLFFFALGVCMNRHTEFFIRITEKKFVFYLAGYFVFSFFYEPMTYAFIRYDPLQIGVLSLVIMSAAHSHHGASTAVLKGNDISYGVYIYHMICANFVIEVYGATPVNALLAFGFTLLVSVLSWFFVEKIAISFKRGPQARVQEPAKA